MPHITVQPAATYEEVLSLPHQTLLTLGQQQALDEGPTPLTVGEWVLTDSPPVPGVTEHLVTGCRHYLHGYLLRIDGNAGTAWTGPAYYLTCNGWVRLSQ